MRLALSQACALQKHGARYRAELTARIRSETVTWAALIKKTGIRLE